MAEDKKDDQDDKKDDQDDQLGDAGQKALARERQARRDAEDKVKKLEPLAAKAQELEDAKKSGEQKLADEIKSLKDDLTKERHRALVAEVAREKGLTAAQARRLEGTTQQELEDDADDLLESFGGKGKSEDDKTDPDDKDKAGADDKNDTDRKKDRGDPGRRPKEKLRSGSVSDSDGDDDDDFDPEKVADAVRSRRI